MNKHVLALNPLFLIMFGCVLWLFTASSGGLQPILGLFEVRFEARLGREVRGVRRNHAGGDVHQGIPVARFTHQHVKLVQLGHPRLERQ